MMGGEMKRPKYPLKLFFRVKRCREKRAKEEEERIRASGEVTGAAKRRRRAKELGKKRDLSEKIKKNNRLYGPEPSVGYTKGGILRVKKS